MLGTDTSASFMQFSGPLIDPRSPPQAVPTGQHLPRRN